MENKNFEDLIVSLKENNFSEIKDIWEEAKQEKSKNNKIFIIACIVIDIIIISLIYNSMKVVSAHFSVIKIMFFLILIIVIDFIIYIFINIFFNKKQKEYKKKFKEVIIKEIINNFYTESKYLPTNKMPNSIYNEARFDEYYNKYNSEDYIEAKLENRYQVKIAEVQTQKVEEYVDSEGNRHKTTKTVFHGVFSRIVIDKSINSELRIKRNGSFILNKKRLEMDSRRI